MTRAGEKGGNLASSGLQKGASEKIAKKRPTVFFIWSSAQWVALSLQLNFPSDKFI